MSLLMVSACGSSGSSSAGSGKQAKSSTTSSTTATTAKRSNCDLATAQQVGADFGATLTAAVQPETGICSYSAPDAAAGGLTVNLSMTSPRGTAYCQSLKSAYTSIPASSTNVQPGQVWSAPSLVANLGGDDGFFAMDLGGQLTWAAMRGDSCTVIGVGGTSWVNSPAGANVNSDVFKLMKATVRNAPGSNG